MRHTTIRGFVSKLIVDPIETTPTGEERSWLPGYPSVEVHTGLGTFEIPWTHDPLPPLGNTVQLTIEWEVSA